MRPLGIKTISYVIPILKGPTTLCQQIKYGPENRGTSLKLSSMERKHVSYVDETSHASRTVSPEANSMCNELNRHASART